METDIEKDSLKYNSIADIEKLLTKEQKEIISIVDQIFEVNIENFNKTFELIEKNSDKICYFLRCISFAMAVRPKTRPILWRLFQRIVSTHKETKGMNFTLYIKRELGTSNDPIFYLKEEKNPYDDSSDDDYDEKEEFLRLVNNAPLLCSEGYPIDRVDCYAILDSFDKLPDDVIPNMIKEDDVDGFIRKSVNSYPKKRFRIYDYNPLNMVSSKSRYVSYAQAAAYYGAIKIFKYVILDGSYPTEDIKKYAIAGGNIEIIKLLEQKGVDFGDCLETAALFHRIELCDWIIRNFKFEPAKTWRTILYFDDRMFFFNAYNGIDMRKSNLLLNVATKVSHFDLIKHLLNKYKEINPSQFVAQLLIDANENNNIELVKFFDELILTNTSYMNRHIYQLATMNGKEELINFLVEKCHIEPKVFCNTAFRVATLKEDLEQMKFLKEKFPIDVNEGDPILINTPLHNAAKENNIEIARFLVEECNADKTKKNRNGEIPLVCALDNNAEDVSVYLFRFHEGESPNIDCKSLSKVLKKGNKELFKLMAEKCKFKVDYNYQKSPAHIAAMNGDLDILAFLHDHNLCMETQQDDVSNTPLLTAVEYNQYEATEYIIKNFFTDKEDMEFQNEDGESPIDIAIRNDNLDIAKLLIKETQQSLHRGYYEKVTNSTSLFVKSAFDLLSVFKTGDHEKIKDVIENKGINVNTILKISTILYRAVKHNDVEMARFLIEECHADPRERNHCEDTLLRCASITCDLEFVKYLVEDCKCDVYLEAEFEEPFHTWEAAISEKKNENAKYLLSKVDCFSFDVIVGSFAAACIDEDDRNDEMIEYLIENASFDISEKGRGGYCLNGEEEYTSMLIKYLIDHGKEDLVKKMIATSPDKKTTKLLINAYVPSNKSNFNGKKISNVLISTIKNGSVEDVKKVIEENNFDINSNIYEIYTYLMYAIDMKKYEIAKYMIEECHANVNAQVTVKNVKKLCALSLAVKNNDIEAVKLLIEVGHADVEIKDEKTRSIIHIAAKKGYLNILKYLIEECHADARVLTAISQSVLLFAVESRKLDVVKYLIEECHLNDLVNIITDCWKMKITPLMYATEFACMDITRYLIDECNADVQYIHVSPMTNMRENMTVENVKYLIEKCNFDVEANDNNKGTNSLHIAILAKKVDVVKYLIEECHADASAVTDNRKTPYDVSLLSDDSITAYIDNITFES